MSRMDLVCTTFGDELARTINRGDNAASRSFMGPRDCIVDLNVMFDTGAGLNRTRRERLTRLLKQSRLLPFQVDAITNIAYRPSSISVKKTVVRRTHHGIAPRRQSVEDTNTFLKSSDLGTAVVNDLLVVAGMTVVTMVASVAFASYRMKEVVNRQEILLREQRAMNWSTRFGARELTRAYTHAVIVMAPQEVASQWEKAASNACALLGERSVQIYRNPGRGAISTYPDTLEISTYTTVAKMSECFRTHQGFVPCVVVDEYVSRADQNIATRKAEDTPIFGRLVMVSADAGNADDIVMGSRRTSLIRNLTCRGEADNDTLKNDVLLSATLLTCGGVLPSKQRDGVAAYILAGLTKVNLEKYTIEYKSSIWSAMLRTSADMLYCPEDLEHLGLKDVSPVRTVGDLLSRIDDVIPFEDDDEVPQQALRLLSGRVRSFLSERDTCPVCLDPCSSEKEVRMICPYWHFVCKGCMEKCVTRRNSCPMCRREITGIADALPVA